MNEQEIKFLTDKFDSVYAKLDGLQKEVNDFKIAMTEKTIMLDSQIAIVREEARILSGAMFDGDPNLLAKVDRNSGHVRDALSVRGVALASVLAVLVYIVVITRAFTQVQNSANSCVEWIKEIDPNSIVSVVRKS